ncbi:nucleoside kinase [Agathobacter rectalis]|jgi:uridine kinase|uniref:Nucleoside kinase n=1 Tax=Agathobacter rectalis TaxID=39491 RepID=A0A413U5S7_9FIRM|nr:nucleoside kinase [Agathobacter rectalis]RHA92801.1 nucleoside kinase [Agathobacter rectalis]RHB05621.1 nucleoside kinase [Agathobacter rectalis]
MQEYSVKVTLPDGQVMAVTASDSDTLEAVADRFKDYYEDDIILGIVNGRLRELNKKIKSDCELSFVTTADRDGRRTYRRSVVLLLQRAIYDVYGSMTQLHVMHSLGEGYYCQLEKAVECADSQQEKYNEDTDLQGSRENSEKSVTEHDIDRIVCSMYSFVEKDLTITKHSAKTQYAEQLFKEKGLHDKERLLHYRRSSRVNLYELDGVVDYFYGFMAPSTGMLKYFDIVPYENGFVLLFPGANSRSVEPLVTSNKLFHTLDDSREWSKMLGIGTIGSLNDAIAAGRGQEIMLLQEALMEQKIGNLAAQIASDDKKKFVMIAGPSSSGKTSFANRLSIQLIAKGRKPHPLSLDDYYVDRELCPKHPDGSFDFECLESIDVKLFNEDMNRLLKGEAVDMPSFNFKTGKREYRGRKLTLGADDILVIEGIHGLNDRLSQLIPPEHKFKIYISALTQLNIDEHNPLSTTDERLIRRIVRDARTRGTNAMETIAMWPSVRKGERENIFPFQEQADVMFNSALVYELAVLKVYAEPLLFGIERDCPEYLEAKRLLKLLDYFLPMPADGIPNNSLLREFVGGSCFNV